MAGWIKIDRGITNHWIWKDDSYLKAWVALLLAANHEEKKTLIQGELIICKRGQIIMSLSSLSSLFGKGWSIQRVRTFLKLLSDDSMIEVEGLSKTTRVTICKYDSYQGIQQTINKQSTNNQQAANKQSTTTKEDKELEELKEDKEMLFESLWKEYPTKTDKKLAKERFLKLKDIDIDLVKVHLPLFSKTKPFETYTHPHLSVYLNKERFRDEIKSQQIVLPQRQQAQMLELTEQEKYEMRKANGLV